MIAGPLPANLTPPLAAAGTMTRNSEQHQAFDIISPAHLRARHNGYYFGFGLLFLDRYHNDESPSRGQTERFFYLFSGIFSSAAWKLNFLPIFKSYQQSVSNIDRI